MLDSNLVIPSVSRDNDLVDLILFISYLDIIFDCEFILDFREQSETGIKIAH